MTSYDHLRYLPPRVGHGERCLSGNFRGPYNDSHGEARLPGVNGEPPTRVEGSSVLVTFSASYWTGVATAGQEAPGVLHGQR